MIRVIVADDHAIVRQGLRSILDAAQDMCCVAEAENAVEAIRAIRDIECDALLLDISMPGKNGIDILKQIRKEKPRLPVLILSMHPEDQYALRAIKAGAAGYLTKQSAPQQLVAAIRQISQGRKFITPELAESLANHLDDDGDQMPHEALSDREFQTLRLIGAGKSLTDIANELCLSVKTVSVYRARLLEKMKLKNNSELTHYVVKNGLSE